MSDGVVFLQDYATPHTAGVTQELLRKFKWEVWRHPPYSPDLAPCDYHLFGSLKQDLGGQRFATDNEVQEAVSKWLKQIGRNFYERGIEKLVTRYEKCLEKLGGYVEK